ncbi:MAG: hypothetical protein KKA79_08920 [Nanoarchaeota archaeon]|nr:hypothetical protein [Nanoarchaeota archaeon]
MKKLWILLVMVVFLAGTVAAGSLSMQLKRTNPGIAGKKEASLIFDVVNTDMDHKMQGFIWCQSPDDAVVSSSYGAGTGTGAQYVSPLFTMDSGPYQSSMTLTIGADSVGDKRAGCTFKYIPYKETVSGGIETTEDFEEEVSIDYGQGMDIGSFIVTYKLYTEAVVDDAETTEVDETAAATVDVDVEGTVKTIEVGSSEIIGSLTVEVMSADDALATLKVSGTKVVAAAGETIKTYQKMNGQEVTTITDMDYRELRLDKSVPFVADMSTPECPEGKEHCTAAEVVDVGGMKIPVWAIIVGALLVILLIAYLLGKTSRS